LVGIINGIDYVEYNPETDKRIPANFSLEDLTGKKDCKVSLQKELGLPARKSAVVGLISRLVDQKGLDILAEAAEDLLSNDLQLVVLGTGEERYEKLFKELAEKYPEKVSANILFDINLAQKIYAGSDMFLMPSKYEPCGLGQMFAMRYGTVPALITYNSDNWIAVVKNAMKTDCSWENSAGEYEKLYKKIIESERRPVDA